MSRRPGTRGATLPARALLPLLLLASLALSPGCGGGSDSSSSAPAVVRGTVVDGVASNLPPPRAGAVVRAYPLSGPDDVEGPEAARTVSGPDGRFTLALRPGRWRVTADLPPERPPGQYAAGAAYLSLAAGQTEEIVLGYGALVE